jgi:hypothetical protein
VFSCVFLIGTTVIVGWSRQEFVIFGDGTGVDESLSSKTVGCRSSSRVVLSLFRGGGRLTSVGSGSGWCGMPPNAHPEIAE